MRSNARQHLAVASVLIVLAGCTREPEHVAVSSDGVNIAFEAQGHGEPTIIFVHGWSNNRTVWDAQMAHFSEKYRAVAVDLAGFGGSGNNRSTWSMEMFADDVVAVMEKLSLQNSVLVGFSMGAPVVIEVANRSPDLVSGLVLVDELHDIDMVFSPEMIAQLDAMFMDVVTHPTPEKLKPFYRKNPEASFKRVLSMVDGAPGKGWHESLIENFRWENDSCKEALQKLEVPLVSINSDQLPTNAEAIKALVPSYKVNIIPDVGHLVMWDAPDEFNRLLEESVQEFAKQ